MSKNSFEMISNKPDCIIVKSKYHYWRILKRDNMYFIHHKYKETDNFHVQCKTPFYNKKKVYQYISSHDEYFEKKLDSDI